MTEAQLPDLRISIPNPSRKVRRDLLSNLTLQNYRKIESMPLR